MANQFNTPNKFERLEQAKCNTNEQGCWLWPGWLCHGYGEVSIKGRKQRAHRWAYELLVGPIPTGLHIDHLCRNRACVNPAHLEPVTNFENTLRGQHPIGVAKRRETCINGHPWTEENTTWWSNGRRNGTQRISRKCRECNKLLCTDRYKRRVGATRSA